MSIVLKRILGSALFCVVSCSSTQYEKRMASWVGRNVIDVERSWGNPARVDEDSGRRVYVYHGGVVATGEEDRSDCGDKNGYRWETRFCMNELGFIEKVSVDEVPCTAMK